MVRPTSLGRLLRRSSCRADHIGGGYLADQQRQVRLGLIQQARGPLGEQVESLQDAVGTGGENNPRQEEADLPGPRDLVELRIPVLREQAKESVDGISTMEKEAAG